MATYTNQYVLTRWTDGTNVSEWSDEYDVDRIQLSRTELASNGGLPYRSGVDWSVTFATCYLSGGVEYGINWTGATPVTFKVFDDQDTAIVDEDLTGAVSLEDQSTARASSGHRGEITVTLDTTHTPDPGTYRFELQATLGGAEYLFSGWIEIHRNI